MDYRVVEYFTRPGGTESIVVKCSTEWFLVPQTLKEKYIKRAKKEKFTMEMNN